MSFDLLDAAKELLAERGVRDVFTTLPDSSKHPEAVVVSLGPSSPQKPYHDGEVSTPLRITVIAKRRSERAAMDDAIAAEKALRTGSLESPSGSYRVDGVDVAFPRPLPWDESGFFAWAFDATVNITRKEFI